MMTSGIPTQPTSYVVALTLNAAAGCHCNLLGGALNVMSALA